jgi:hypothetical protein
VPDSQTLPSLMKYLEGRKVWEISCTHVESKLLTCSQRSGLLTVDVRLQLLSDLLLHDPELPEQSSRSLCQALKWPAVMLVPGEHKGLEIRGPTSSNKSTLGLRRRARAMAIRSTDNWSVTRLVFKAGTITFLTTRKL